MTTDAQQGVLFEKGFEKPVHMEFTQPAQSSDGGAVLLKAADEELGLTEKMADSLQDRRDPSKISHSLQDLLRERVMGIACGYEDCNDAETVRDDPVMKMLCDRNPIDGDPVGSQPTLSRFENMPGSTELLRVGFVMADSVIDNQRRKREDETVFRVTLDLDPTVDETYGQQEFAEFRSHYKTWCYYPMMATLQFNGESRQYPVAPLLRRGRAGGYRGACGLLKRLVPRLRKAFPHARIHVRLDGAFASPKIYRWLEKKKLLYVINFPKNEVVEEISEPLMEEVREAAEASGETERLFGEYRYQARSWDQARRLVIKAEVTCLEGRAPRDNPRFLVTNLSAAPGKVYRYYGMRGDMENRIKELKHGLAIDRTSCSKFKANQLRLLLTMAAYVLLQEIRDRAVGTEFHRAQVQTLREKLLKIGVVVKESVRRILLEAPAAYPWLDSYRQVATAFR